MKRSALLSICVLSLGGCAVGPIATPLNAPIPAKWSEAPDDKASPAHLGDWWRSFNDPVLDGLIKEAIAGNQSVASAKAKVREARASRRVSAAALLPALSGTASSTEQQLSASQTGAAEGGASNYNQFVGGLDASWEIDIFGGNRRSLEAYDFAAHAAEDDLDAALLTLVGDVATYYIELRGYQARIALARSTAESQRKTAALTRIKFQVGSASAVDTFNAEALAANTEATIPPFRASFAQAMHRLGILIGQAPGALAARLAVARPVPSTPKSLPLGLPADLLSNRPDVRAAEKRVAQYTAQIGYAEAQLYPKLTLTGSLYSNAFRIEDFAKASTIAWSLGPSLSIPFFQGGQLTAQVDYAKATRDEYLVSWRATVLTALEDVENAIVALAQEKLHAKKLAESAAGYAKAAALSRSLYTLGSSSFLEVLDAERSLYSEQDSLLVSRVAIATDHVALAKALGGGWTRPVDSASPEVIDVNEGPRVATAQEMMGPEPIAAIQP
ncbi:efflux transporter outer membrane subunit [Methylocella silvestris]|uniref:RND transporter n=1 Tax=Methylocella silvestris TaxID=199596 RepID=A0A2J7TCT4_METSI|nr:efflux transporter outer membrane subunit [Methylocella silvestris]PNG24565.1 RND transporter [Methylocella silvestris]